MRRMKMWWFVVLFAASSSVFAEDDAVEKAWACEPSFGKAVSEDYINYNTVPKAQVYAGLLSWEETSPLDIFQFGKCQELSKEEKMALAKTLLDSYGNRSKGADGTNVWVLSSFVSAQKSRERAAEREFQEEAKREKQRAEEKRQAEEQEKREKEKADALSAKEAEKLARQQQLRSGVIKPASMKDVWLASDQIFGLHEIMASALLKADNAVYGGKVIIDGEERERILRVRFDSDVFDEVAYQTPWQEDGVALDEEMAAMAALRGRALSQALSQNGTRHYAQLNLSKKTISFIRNSRIGSVVWVVGRYKANRKYKLVNRTERTMPVLDVLYIGE